MIGYVYLIGTRTFKWYKIGKSKTPEVRIQDLGILLPFKIEVIGIWKAQNHSLLESTLHEQYAEKQVNGEWFHFTKKEVVELFESLPVTARIFPTESTKDSFFAKFTNAAQECPEGKKISYRLRPMNKYNMSDEERERRRQESMKQHNIKKKRRLISEHMQEGIKLLDIKVQRFSSVSI